MKKVFTRYNSIENSYREKFLHKIESEGHTEGLWCIKEKIHGANFSITVLRNEEGDLEAIPGKRTGYLKEDERFHSARSIVKDLETSLFALFNDIQPNEDMVVFGEIFGGNYPHHDVDSINVKQVQGGVYYSPKHEVMAFDLKVDGYLIKTSEADLLFLKHNIPYIPNIFVGTYRECLAHSEEFQTTIPNLLGLPPIENNIAEGFVMKPLHETPFLYDGSRVILKKRAEKFKEVQRKPKTKVHKDPLPEDVQSLLHTLSEYCTVQRVASVVSKMGEIKMSDFGQVMKNTNIDVLEEFDKDHSSELNILDKKYRTLVSKKVGSYNAVVIKQYFRANI